LKQLPVGQDMRISMSYGKKGLPLDLPEDWNLTVIQKREMPVLPDPEGALRAAFSQPEGSRPLVEEAKGRHRACVLICDVTRPVPNAVILPELVRTLMESGMSPSGINVLVATGLHRPNEGAELCELVGDDWVLDTVNIENHFARNDQDHVMLGVTKRGTKIRLDRRFVQADLRIVVGLVEPHFMAGYSGGRKIILPGVAHQETITALHTASILEDPRAANCVLEGNPLHEEQLEVVRMLGGALAVNTVIDEHRRISFVNFGEIAHSHLSAVAHMRKYSEIPVPRKFRTVITSSAGYPLDKTYYQTVKGMVGAMDVLEPGGSLFIVSECSEGMGSPEFVEAQRQLITLGADGFLKKIRPKRHAAIDEWQTEMQLKPMRIGEIHLYTEGLSESERRLTGVHLADGPGQTIQRLVSAAQDTHVAVIPEGPYVVPIHRPHSLTQGRVDPKSYLRGRDT
jgi:nickel-dependent lactate racemase